MFGACVRVWSVRLHVHLDQGMPIIRVYSRTHSHSHTHIRAHVYYVIDRVCLYFRTETLTFFARAIETANITVRKRRQEQKKPHSFNRRKAQKSEHVKILPSVAGHAAVQNNGSTRPSNYDGHALNNGNNYNIRTERRKTFGEITGFSAETGGREAERERERKTFGFGTLVTLYTACSRPST